MVLRFLRKQREGEWEIPTVDDAFRVYAIGDIHGCHGLLIDLLARISSDAEKLNDGRRFVLVFLGDYVDRGAETDLVLDTLTRISSLDSDQVVFLKGNHEDALLRFLQDPVGGKAWLEFGGRQTLASFGVWAPISEPSKEDLYEISDQLSNTLSPYLKFLNNLRLKYRCGNVVFTHAGLNPKFGWDQSDEFSPLWGNADFLHPNPFPGLRVVHGHYDDTVPVSHPGRLCVDTGAYYSGKLTAVRLDDGETFISVGGLSRQSLL